MSAARRLMDQYWMREGKQRRLRMRHLSLAFLPVCSSCQLWRERFVMYDGGADNAGAALAVLAVWREGIEVSAG